MKKFRNYKNYKYDITREGNKTIATATYAGVPVQAHAKLDPRDIDTPELAAELAKARCNEKIAAKRCKRAYSKVDEAAAQVIAAMMHYEKMLEYEADAEDNYNEASYELAVLLNEKYGCNCGDECTCDHVHEYKCECGCDCDCGENCECGCHN